ncbi:MAG: hydroxymethylbilane synthase [Verrucomicrobiota bacterium]
MKRKFIIGTRGSSLAVIQAEWVAQNLKQFWGDDYEFELKIIKTTGDVLQKKNTLAKPPKGLFTKEIEIALQMKNIDLAVHSCKDLPIELDKIFCMAAVPQRASAHDALISKSPLNMMPQTACILSGSPRRKSQWMEQHPQTSIEPIRGNIDTRIKKLRENSNAWGLILAEAGLQRRRPSLDDLHVHVFSLEEMLPAPGQGALAIEVRTADEEAHAVAAKLNDPISEIQIKAERAFLKAMGGGCRAAIGAYAEPLKDGNLKLYGVSYDLNAQGIRKSKIGNDPECLGKTLAEEYR